MTCNKCRGTGLIPFINQRGEVTPHTFLHCDCHPVYGTKPAPGRYHHVSPADIDYPVSYGHYRMLCAEHGWPDPGPDRPHELEAKPQRIEHIIRHSDMSKKEFAKLQEVLRRLNPIERREDKKPVSNSDREDITDKVYR